MFPRAWGADVEPTPKKIEYPRLESHTKDKDGTWHSLSLYVDKTNQPMGRFVVENKVKGISEKHDLQYQLNGKVLQANVQRDSGKQMIIVIKPNDNQLKSSVFNGKAPVSVNGYSRNQTSAGFASLMPVVENSLLKPNKTMQERGSKDRTVQFLQKNFNVNPVQQKGLNR